VAIVLARRFARVIVVRKAFVVPVAAALLTAASVAPTAFAATTNTQRQQQVNKQLSQLKTELNEVTSDEADLLGKIDELNNRKAELDAKVADLQAKMDAAQRELDAATARLAEVQRRVNEAQARLEAAKAALELSAQRMTAQAVAAYMGGEVDNDLTNFVLHANDMREVSAASEYMGQIVRDKRAVVEEHRELEGQANDARIEIEKARIAAEEERNVIAQRTQQLQAQKGELDGVNAELQAEAAKQDALLVEIESKRASIQAQVDELQRQSDAIAAQLRQVDPVKPGSPPPSSGRGILANPVPGAAATSRFGMRTNPVTGKYVLHAGQDYGVPVGTPLRAAADGTVVSASAVGGYGKYTCISHGNGLATCYAHQSKFMVSAGQKVTRNQIVGLSGNTGNSTGPHLHFEVRVNGNPVDPAGYL
jgi:murein DD-endopeptidase MepM/ murein hydrolase activator NlpD